MKNKHQSLLNPRRNYLQIALNGTLSESKSIIFSLPKSNRILIEVGTPFIKRYGIDGIKKVKKWYSQHLQGIPQTPEVENVENFVLQDIFKAIAQAENPYIPKEEETPSNSIREEEKPFPYIVADLKMMDRGAEEAKMAYEAGANAAVALGAAPIESLNEFIESCYQYKMDPIVDMMNIEYPLSVLRQLKRQPHVIILHRGVDEEKNKAKMLPLHEIRRIKAEYSTMLAIAGGDTIREVQSAIFNDADIVVVWKDFYESTGNESKLAKEFLEKIK